MPEPVTKESFRAVVVGERSLVLGFKGAGFEIRSADSGARAQTELQALARDPGVALVLLTESLAAEAGEAIKEFREVSRAILCVIPTHEGSRHVGFEEMRKATERSIGVDLLGKGAGQA